MKSTILQKAIKSDDKRILYKNYPVQTIKKCYLIDRH